MAWSKKLAKTDAQRDTNGRKVPYLRLTRSGFTEDTTKWFRQNFFGAENWTYGHFGKHAVEIAHVPITVRVGSANLGTRKLLVTHDAGRQARGKGTANTWIHYDDAIIDELKKKNYHLRPVVLSATKGGYSLEFD